MSGNGSAQGDDGYSFSVTVARVDGRWNIATYRDEFETLSTSTSAVRSLRSEGPAFAMLCVDDDYFVIVRPSPRGTRVLLSDATMAVDDDFAAACMDDMDADIPDLDPEELEDVDPWAEGDFDILADLGLNEQVLTIICDDDDLWPSDQLLRIAEELGFADELAAAVGMD